MRVHWYCKCGATWGGDLPKTLVPMFRALWNEAHPEGVKDKYGIHGETDVKTCTRHRYEAERRAVAQAHIDKLRHGGQRR